MKGEMKSTTIIKKYGYEYHLVEVYRPESFKTEQPCFMGYKGMTLSKCVKIVPQSKNKKK